MKILFCCNPLNSCEVDYDYEHEYYLANKLGFSTGLIVLDELLCSNAKKAISRINPSDKIVYAIYRGWMMKPSEYESLYNALLEKNIKLVNSPDEYKNCHYLPLSYDKIKDYSPKSIWIEEDKCNDLDFVSRRVVEAFGSSSIIVKDYVKSCKHNWEDACFIPNPIDKDNVKRVIQNFIELRGSDFAGGLVFRDFVNLEFLTKHSKSKMPLSIEHRLFFFGKKLIATINYWEEGDYSKNLTPTDEELSIFLNIGKNIPSNFFTMDIAKTKEGKWIIVELGDGQVSGLSNEESDCLLYEVLSLYQ